MLTDGKTSLQTSDTYIPEEKVKSHKVPICATGILNEL